MADTTAPRGRLLSADEVAHRLNISGRHVRRLPPSDLPYLVLAQGGPRKYRPEDVDLYVRRHLVRR